MKKVLFSLAIVLLAGCTYANRVQSLTDSELCRNLGEYSLYGHEEGIRISKNEIQRRNLNKDQCETIANNTIDRLSPEYKLKLCQNLAEYHYKGAYRHFKRTLDKIKERGYADEECQTMADFYYIRLTRKQEKAQAIADALNQAAENMRETNERLYGRGSYLNPIHIKLQ